MSRPIIITLEEALSLQQGNTINRHGFMIKRNNYPCTELCVGTHTLVHLNNKDVNTLLRERELKGFDHTILVEDT